MSASTITSLTPNPLDAIKSRQQIAWSTGNYAVIGTTLQIVGEQLCEALDLHAGAHVLDVAAGNGNATLAAARRFCSVVSSDYVPALLEAGKVRAQAEDLDITFQEADAEKLPFANESFDAVLSTFGVMFTPQQQKAANELVRVCRRGGKIGLANWTPESFIGQLFRIVGQYVPPAPGLTSPMVWGTQSGLIELFFNQNVRITTHEREFVFRYHSAAHWLDIFRTYYGPLNKAFNALDAGDQAALAADLLALMENGNRSGDGTLVLPSQYLEAVIELR